MEFPRQENWSRLPLPTPRNLPEPGIKPTVSYVSWIGKRILYHWATKNLPAIQTRVQSLGQQDPLDKGMVTHSSILTWKIPWTEEPGWLQSIGLRRVGHDWATNTVTCDWFWPIGSGGRWDPSLSAGAIWNCGNHVSRCFTRWRESGSTESNMEGSGGLPDPITLSVSEKLTLVGWSHWDMGVYWFPIQVLTRPDPAALWEVYWFL